MAVVIAPHRVHEGDTRAGPPAERGDAAASDLAA